MSSLLSLLQFRAFRRFAVRVGQSRFFMISLAFHFVLVLLLGGVVLVQKVAPRSEFDDATGGSTAASTNASAPDPALQALQEAAQPSANSATTLASNSVPSLAPIISASALPSDFSLPSAPLVPPPTSQTARQLSSGAAPPADNHHQLQRHPA